jgi:hypothetical protein
MPRRAPGIYYTEVEDSSRYMEEVPNNNDNTATITVTSDSVLNNGYIVSRGYNISDYITYDENNFVPYYSSYDNFSNDDEWKIKFDFSSYFSKPKKRCIKI